VGGGVVGGGVVGGGVGPAGPCVQELVSV
jgi:hypothetical protein